MLYWKCCPPTIQPVSSCCVALLCSRLVVSWDYHHQHRRIMSLTDEWPSSRWGPPDRYGFCWEAWSMSKVWPEPELSGLTCHNFLLHWQSRISATATDGHANKPCFSEHNVNTDVHTDVYNLCASPTTDFHFPCLKITVAPVIEPWI